MKLLIRCLYVAVIVSSSHSHQQCLNRHVIDHVQHFQMTIATLPSTLFPSGAKVIHATHSLFVDNPYLVLTLLLILLYDVHNILTCLV